MHCAPAVLDVVGALEQRLVAGQAIVDQRLVARGRLHLEKVLVGKTQLDVLHGQGRARALGLQVEPHAFVGLDLDLQVVGLEPLDLGVTKLGIGRWLEADGNLGIAHAHALAGAQVERHADPAPVVDHHLERDEGFGVAVGLDPRLFAVTGHVLAPLLARRVLAAHRVLQGHVFRPGPDRADDLGFLASDRIGAKGCRRLHGDHGQ
ncbi:hypothetical protein D3C81_877630 [compost metagenome]